MYVLYLFQTGGFRNGDFYMTDITMSRILYSYYTDNARKLRLMVDKILSKFGGLSDKDYGDFYSLANEVFTDILRGYDKEEGEFDGFLYSCLSNRVKSEITKRNRNKRKGDRQAISIDMTVSDEDDLTLGDIIEDDFDMDSVLEEKFGGYKDEKVEKYLSNLSEIQRKIVEMKMEDVSVSEIKKRLKLSDKQYKRHCQGLRAFDNISVLYIDGIRVDMEEKGLKMRNDMINNTMTVTMEKSKPNRLSIASIIKKIEKHTIRFDHPLQRESEQWSPSMKGNLISDILQGNPIPSLVFAEQIVNGIAIIWDLDGKQRCTNAYSFSKDGYKISKNIRRWMIKYQAPVVGPDGKTVLDKNNFPIYENREFDIRGKKFSDLPEELQEKFNDYNFEIVQYLNCSSDDIAYHIARYNEGKPMTASQKGITRLGEEYAGTVKSISSMPFFKDMGGYKVSEFRNGTINRVVVESVMAVNFLDDWKKKQEDMCEYIRDHATSSDFDNFEDMVGRLEKVMTDTVSDMFDSKDSFLWFGLYAGFIRSETDDMKFIGFMKEFADTLHCKKIGGISFDDLNGKSTKDKNVVIAKMNHLKTLMNEHLGIKGEEAVDKDADILFFLRENVSQDITREDIMLYNDILDDLAINVDSDSKLLIKCNRETFIAVIAYACIRDIDLDDCFGELFRHNDICMSDLKESYFYMKNVLDRYVKNNKAVV